MGVPLWRPRKDAYGWVRRDDGSAWPLCGKLRNRWGSAAQRRLPPASRRRDRLAAEQLGRILERDLSQMRYRLRRRANRNSVTQHTWAGDRQDTDQSGQYGLREGSEEPMYPHEFNFTIRRLHNSIQPQSLPVPLRHAEHSPTSESESRIFAQRFAPNVETFRDLNASTSNLTDSTILFSHWRYVEDTAFPSLNRERDNYEPIVRQSQNGLARSYSESAGYSSADSDIDWFESGVSLRRQNAFRIPSGEEGSPAGGNDVAVSYIR